MPVPSAPAAGKTVSLVVDIVYRIAIYEGQARLRCVPSVPLLQPSSAADRKLHISTSLITTNNIACHY